MQLSDVLTAATGLIVAGATALLWWGALRKIRREEHHLERPAPRRSAGVRAAA